MQFTVTTDGANRLGLAELCQHYIDELWLLDHMTRGEAAEAALDQFKRPVLVELELLSVECV